MPFTGENDNLEERNFETAKSEKGDTSNLIQEEEQEGNQETALNKEENQDTDHEYHVVNPSANEFSDKNLRNRRTLKPPAR